MSTPTLDRSSGDTASAARAASPGSALSTKFPFTLPRGYLDDACDGFVEVPVADLAWVGDTASSAKPAGPAKPACATHPAYTASVARAAGAASTASVARSASTTRAPYISLAGHAAGGGVHRGRIGVWHHIWGLGHIENDRCVRDRGHLCLRAGRCARFRWEGDFNRGC